MWVFARLFRCLLIRGSLCFLGWLVVWVYGQCVLVCFSALAAHFHGILTLLEICVFLALWGALGLPPLNHLGLHFATFVGSFYMFLVLGGALGPSLLIFELHLGVLGVHFRVFLQLWGRTLDPFFDFPGKGPKKE